MILGKGLVTYHPLAILECGMPLVYSYLVWILFVIPSKVVAPIMQIPIMPNYTYLYNHPIKPLAICRTYARNEANRRIRLHVNSPSG
jgi:hypothetical protein